ncbi:MAG: Kelch repeat-containing protein [Candidatus Hodarchaeales archaeon]|jgi:N-acetylneuraminic acid mutarotase
MEDKVGFTETAEIENQMKHLDNIPRNVTFQCILFLTLLFMINNNQLRNYQYQIPSFSKFSIQDNSDWIEMTPTIAPPARYQHAYQSAYDTQSDRLILFSGDIGDYSTIYNDTWAYDYNTNTWENLTTDEMKNCGKIMAAMACDSESDRIIMFGVWFVRNGAAVYQAAGVGETWSYDYETNSWNNLTTINCPPFRGAASMTYDEAHDRMILYGGFNSEMYDSGSTSSFFQETWAYDYNTNTWTNMSPTTNPPPLGNHDSVYDHESGKTIIFGGRSCQGCPSLKETWAYDYTENTWINMNPTNSPPRRIGGSMTYSSVSDRTILFGGFEYLTDKQYADTWTYDYNSNTWVDTNSPFPPSARFSHTLDYDSESDIVIAYGGTSDDANGNGIFLDETWAYHYQLNTPSVPQNPQISLNIRDVVLMWEQPTTDGGALIEEYVIYRGMESDILEVLANTDQNDVFSFIDTRAKAGRTYYYSICAKNGIGEGEMSTILSITTPPSSRDDSLLIMGVVLLALVLIWIKSRAS